MDVAGLDLHSECLNKSLGCSGSGDNSAFGFRAEKPKHLSQNIMGLVQLLIAQQQIDDRVARIIITTSNNYELSACTHVQYWAG